MEIVAALIFGVIIAGFTALMLVPVWLRVADVRRLQPNRPQRPRARVNRLPSHPNRRRNRKRCSSGPR